MSETDDSPDEDVPETRRGMGAKGWIVTALLAAMTGGGGFYAASSGLADGLLKKETEAKIEPLDAESPAFVELDPLTVSVGGAGSVRQLRFRAFLQLAPNAHSDVAALQPRILDVFATYLRAVSVDRLEDPTSLLHLRAQLLRRVQLLAGPEEVADLLIIDFVIT